MADSSAHRPVPSVNRDRHGRGMRGPLLAPGIPARRTRRQRFDDMVAEQVEEIARRWPVVNTIEFGVEDVPPSPPAEWEDQGVQLARIFPADWVRGLSDRIVIYRRAVEQRASSPEEEAEFTRQLLIDRISHVVAVSPADLESGSA